jgi:3-hydroxyisobutyrate dehydrogenase-like beta-hydroxyacid dehydrogenase
MLQMDGASQSVAVIGLGAMGLPIAINLIKAGYTVYGCDLSASRRDLLVNEGAHVVTNPAELPSTCSIFLLLLPNPAITETALFGPEGLAHGVLSTGDVVLNLGTIGPDSVLMAAERLREMDVDVLDVPMGKSSADASDGTLSLMVSGDDLVIAGVVPILEAIATEITYCGALGVASTLKLVNNLVSATIVDVVAQGFALGTAAGASVDLIIKVMASTGADNWHLRNTFARKVVRRDFTAGASIDVVAKDMKLGLDMAARKAVPLPTLAVAYQHYIAAQAAGYGPDDWGSLAKIAERDAGLPESAIHYDGEIALTNH